MRAHELGQNDSCCQQSLTVISLWQARLQGPDNWPTDHWPTDHPPWALTLTAAATGKTPTRFATILRAAKNCLLFSKS